MICFKRWIKVTIWIFKEHFWGLKSRKYQSLLIRLFGNFMCWQAFERKFKFRTIFVMPKEPLFGWFWVQNQHFSYFLFHCFIFCDKTSVRTGGSLLLRICLLIFSNSPSTFANKFLSCLHSIWIIEMFSLRKYWRSISEFPYCQLYLSFLICLFTPSSLHCLSRNFCLIIAQLLSYSVVVDQIAFSFKAWLHEIMFIKKLGYSDLACKYASWSVGLRHKVIWILLFSSLYSTVSTNNFFGEN